MDEVILKEYKKKLIQVLEAFITICESNGLSYYCCGGTALGAVRHRGIIPWDDDVDVLMPRDDYERFVEIFNDVTNNKYDLLIPDITKNYYLPYLKMCDRNSTVLEYRELPCVFGVFIDIFPLDGAPDDCSQHKKIINCFEKNANKLRAISKRPKDNLLHFLKRILNFQLNTAINELFYLFFKDFQRKKILKRLNNIMRTYKYDDSLYVCNYGGRWGIREFVKKEWFASSTLLEFENMFVRLPVNYDAYLTNLYDNYMEEPPKKMQISNHSHYFLNLNKRLSIEEILTKK